MSSISRGMSSLLFDVNCTAVAGLLVVVVVLIVVVVLFIVVVHIDN
jgi:hypothetical protein